VGLLPSVVYANEQVPLVLQLDWIPNVQFAGILLAEAKGWYRDNGIVLSIHPGKHGVDFVDKVVSEAVVIGDTDAPTIILSRAKGIPIKAIGTMFQIFPWGLMTLKDSNIHTPQQLKGKKIGLHFPIDFQTLEVVLAAVGMRLNDVTVVKVGFDLSPFIQREIDAMQCYIIDEPAALKARGIAVNVIRAADYGYTMYSQVFFCTEQLIHTRPELIKTFLAVSFYGWKEAIKDPETTARLVVERYYLEGDLAYQKESMKLIPYLVTKGVGSALIGMMNRTVWKGSIELLLRFGMLQKPVDPDEVFTLQFLRSIYGF
jgi:ABC-type nitrate/sulfonate/bicarbonate transport system substrate-binding protein